MQGRHPGIPRVHFATAGVGCCLSILDAAAIVCLILAIWQAVSGTAAQGPARQAARTLESE